MTALRVAYAEHAVSRFIERVRPSCGHDTAVAQLAGVASVLQLTAPAWLLEGPLDPPNGYACLGDDIAFVLRLRPESDTYVAVTCLTRRARPRHPSACTAHAAYEQRAC